MQHPPPSPAMLMLVTLACRGTATAIAAPVYQPVNTSPIPVSLLPAYETLVPVKTFSPDLCEPDLSDQG